MQLIVSCKFFKHTRDIMEVGLIPKVMTALANLSGIVQLIVSIRFTLSVVLNREREDLEKNETISLLLVGSIPFMINMAQWVRFRKVQVQLES